MKVVAHYVLSTIQEEYGRMASVVAINKNTGGSISSGCDMNPAKKSSPLKRRLWKCDTTPAGDISFYHAQDSDPSVYRCHEHTISHDLCCLRRSADIALVAGGNRKRWIIATENMQVGDVIKTSGVIGRMAGVGYTSWFVVSLKLP